MTKFIKTFLIAGSLLAGSIASADSYTGYYQFKDDQGRILYQSALKLQTQAISNGKTQRTYVEAANGKATVCTVVVKNLANSTSSWTETCPTYVQSSVCQNDLCSGILNDSIQGDLPVASSEKSDKKSLVIFYAAPVEYLGIKNIKSFNQVLVLDK